MYILKLKEKKTRNTSGTTVGQSAKWKPQKSETKEKRGTEKQKFNPKLRSLEFF